jgi:methylenetetrahydrofolate--tRNA-(uracil-5-)-methyltransferase
LIFVFRKLCGQTAESGLPAFLYRISRHMPVQNEITIIGGGLAGCEAAWQAAQRGCRVTLYEMKPQRFSPAHTSAHLAELVCSNSLKAEGLSNASGVLKDELRMLDSLVIRQADASRVPAGAALAVDRQQFASSITKAIEQHPHINLVRDEIAAVHPEGIVIVATGPLTSDAFAAHLQDLIGGQFLFFHDAIAPIVEADSIDPKKTYRASRYDKGDADYINCPLTQEEYYTFVRELLAADKVLLREFETLVPFEGCMPVEVMAERGVETLAYGPMKPVGLIDPHTGNQPYAVVQLRQENFKGTLYNIVGFQTRLKWPEQERVFGFIPGLEHAVFVRHGSMHRNTFIHSPVLLSATLQLKAEMRIFFAGQITGVEGYVESIATGLIAGINAARYAAGLPLAVPPAASITGALIASITDSSYTNFQPMNANFGILPSLSVKARKTDRKRLHAERALREMRAWKESLGF